MEKEITQHEENAVSLIEDLTVTDGRSNEVIAGTDGGRVGHDFVVTAKDAFGN